MGLEYLIDDDGRITPFDPSWDDIPEGFYASIDYETAKKVKRIIEQPRQSPLYSKMSSILDRLERTIDDLYSGHDRENLK